MVAYEDHIKPWHDIPGFQLFNPEFKTRAQAFGNFIAVNDDGRRQG